MISSVEKTKAYERFRPEGSILEEEIIEILSLLDFNTDNLYGYRKEIKFWVAFGRREEVDGINFKDICPHDSGYYMTKNGKFSCLRCDMLITDITNTRSRSNNEFEVKIFFKLDKEFKFWNFGWHGHCDLYDRFTGKPYKVYRCPHDDHELFANLNDDFYRKYNPDYQLEKRLKKEWEEMER